MFVKSLKITDHHQFKDFELDLTYPKGHEKAGEPLDKVCIIGQSGTGKTTLLEEIASVGLRTSVKKEFRSTKIIENPKININSLLDSEHQKSILPTNNPKTLDFVLLGMNNINFSGHYDAPKKIASIYGFASTRVLSLDINNYRDNVLSRVCVK
jgi:hypothetical protein